MFKLITFSLLFKYTFNMNCEKSVNYRELVSDLDENFKEKVINLDKKDIKNFYPFKSFKEKLFILLNPKLNSSKKLFCKDGVVWIGYVYKRFIKKNRLDIYRVNFVFSPISKILDNPNVICSIMDKYIQRDIDMSLNLCKFKDNKEKELMNRLFSEDANFEIYEVENEENIILYAASCFIDLNLFPEYVFKQLFIPILFNQNISKEAILLPIDFYTKDYLEYVKELDENKESKEDL